MVLMQNNFIEFEIEIDSTLKEEASKVLSKQDLDLNTAINMFFNYCVVNGKLPFEIEQEAYHQEILEGMEKC